jgi:hypothetical protein
MRILVTEQSPGQGKDLAQRLRYLGCVVSTCHDANTDVCNGVVPGGCPLEGRWPADLVVDVRADQELTAREYGAVCGIRAGLPVVLTGLDWQDKPFVPDGLRHRATAIRQSALLIGCVDALRDEKIVNERAER